MHHMELSCSQGGKMYIYELVSWFVACTTYYTYFRVKVAILELVSLVGLQLLLLLHSEFVSV